MGQAISNQQHVSEELYFIDSYNNFLSISMNLNSLKINITEGKLKNLKEDLNSIRNTEKTMGSFKELISFISHFIGKKTLQGYTLLDLENKTSAEKRECDDLSSKDQIPRVSLSMSSLDTAASLVEKSFNLCHFQNKDIKNIKTKAAELGLEYEIIRDKIIVVGTQQLVLEFVNWLYEFLNMSLSMNKQDYSHDEVSINTFHRVHKDEIIEKANELSITCDFRYHMILMTGLCEKLKEFKNYLHQVETSAKKELYPKYWDLEDQKVYSEIEVSPESLEFDEVKSLMTASIPDAEVLKLKRIQNNYLMTHYITNLNMRREVRKDCYNDRVLLFYGTRNVEPSQIYKSFDTGFDLQYSSGRGLYGKGLYFAQIASYCHSYAHIANNGNLQMLLADVFVGKPYFSGANNKLIKAPDGYDSIFSSRGVYIIYNNFHSYPLYLIEYKLPEKSANTDNVSYPPPPSVLPIQRPIATSTPTANTNSPHQTVKIQGSSVSIVTSNTTPPPTQSPQKQTDLAVNNQILSPIASKRVQSELKDLQADTSLDYFFIELPDEKDLSKWTVRIIGPSYSPYEGGIFQVGISFPWNYPLNAPVVTFQTKIYHPCVDEYGNVCLGVISNWTPAIDMRQVLLTLSALLDNPSMEEPLNLKIDCQYRNAKIEFSKQAHAWTEKYAL